MFVPKGKRTKKVGGFAADDENAPKSQFRAFFAKVKHCHRLCPHGVSSPNLQGPFCLIMSIKRQRKELIKGLIIFHDNDSSRSKAGK